MQGPYKQPNFISQEIRKKIKTKFKVIREKEVIQIGVEISDIENRKQQENKSMKLKKFQLD